MSAVLTSLAKQAVLAQAAATDGSPRALDQVARQHGLMLKELRDLVEKAAAAPAETHRTCCTCEIEKPIDDFYRQERGRGGRMPQCIKCNNARPPTKVRMLRNRARSRAVAVLAQRHPAEYEALYAEQLVAAEAEYDQLQAAAAGNHDSSVPRLRPGPVREGETKLDRLDVARCVRCRTHHDAEHECPNCGGVTPEVAPSEKPWEVRQWAKDNGIAVPGRGPLPERVVAAFRAAHPVADHELDDGEVDPVVVQRILDGDWNLRANKAEKVAVTEAWLQSGRATNELARLTGWKTERYARVTPIRKDEAS